MINRIGIAIGTTNVPFSQPIVAPVATAATGVGMTSFTANWNAFSGASYYLLDVSISSSFSTFILQNTVTTATSYVVTGLTSNTTYYYRVRAAVDIDADFSSYISRVYTAGGALTYTEVTATNQLVLDLKANSLWTPMKAIYPMVGASAAACAQNLKSSSFTGSFSSGWTFASTGVTPNGTSAYFNTTLVPNTSLTNNNLHYSFYSRTQNSQNSAEIGSSNFGNINQYTLDLYYLGVSEKVFVAGSYPTNSAISTNTDTLGFGIGSRTSTTSAKVYMDGVLLGTQTNTNPNTLSTSSIYIGCHNMGGTAVELSSKECAFSSIGDGLTDTQASNFYTTVQKFNQSLNRQVGAQIVSDSDAQAYIDRVYTAGGTLTNTEATAVNQLTIDLKSNGTWSSMKAIYPMIGASAAACAQNLKSSSFTGTFTSGWTFASTGATPNGTSAYMDTNLNPNTSLTNLNTHLSYYSRTNQYPYIGSNVAMCFGAAISPAYLPLSDLELNGGTGSNNTFGVYMNDYNTGFLRVANTDTRGFLFGNRTASNVLNMFRNGTKIGSNTSTTSQVLPNTNYYLNALNLSNTALLFSNAQCAFGSIGDGLTDTQASNFYTSVQAFQTTLSRAIAP